MNNGDVTRTNDRREAQRYPVRLPIEFEDGTGITCNMSTAGVLFETDREFAPGAHIRFLLVVEQDEGVLTRLHCEGTVVNAERRGSRWEVAVHTTSFRFERHV